MSDAPACETCEGKGYASVECPMCLWKPPQYNCRRCDNTGVIEMACPDCQDEADDE